MTDAVIAILAGGQGSRFWPVSRTSRPKQFLSISDAGESLIQATVRRILPITTRERIWIISSESLEGLVKEHVPGLNVVCEPTPRNTAASIGFTAIHAQHKFKDQDPVLVMLPADHAIKDEDKLRDSLKEAIQVAQNWNSLVTIGIPPTLAHTGYGYIKRGSLVSGKTHRVERFFEKPSLERAEKYLESGEYLWNSGMFAWRASVILEAFKEYLPVMYEGLNEIKALLDQSGDPKIKQKLNEKFLELESISIDFGILEHARNCLVVSADQFGWNDVGTWDQWAENFDTDQDGNLVKGDAIVIDSNGCVIQSDKRLLAVVGAQDLVIIDTGDALLVSSRASVQDVRKVVEELKKKGRFEMV